MARLFVLVFILWFFLFLLRIFQINGLDPSFREQPSQLLKPLQQSLDQTAKKILPYPEGALLSGMLVGNQGKIPFELKQQLITTSTIHLIVVSGQNLSILAGFVIKLAPWLGRKKTLILTLGIIIFYSFLTGLQVPVLRAGLMAGASYLAQLLGKETMGWWVLFLTAGLMLLYNPNYLFSISFQLSFLATLAVVTIAPILLKKLHFVPKILREDLGVTISAQILTLGVIAFYFQRISLIGILANSLLLWSIPLLMISGFLALGAGLVNQLLGQLIGLVPSILLTYFIDIVKIFSGFSFSSLEIGETSLWLWLGYYLLLGAIFWGIDKNSKIKEAS